MQLFVDVRVCVVQVVKDVGSEQTSAVILRVVVWAWARLAAPKDANESRILNSIIKFVPPACGEIEIENLLQCIFGAQPENNLNL